MNKKLLLLGAVAVAGFITLTAFGPKQDQQKADIAQKVAEKLDELRAQKDQECTDRVNAEAQVRYDAMVAAEPAPAPGKKPGKTTTKKGSGPKVDTVPVGTKPTDPAQAKKDKTAGSAPVNTEVKQSKTAGEAPPPNTDKKKAKTSGGGGN